jgi:hypothetical protein
VGNTEGDNTGFTASGAGNNQNCAFGGSYGPVLLGIKFFFKGFQVKHSGNNITE